MFVQIWLTECKNRLFRCAGNFLLERTNYSQKQAEASTDGSEGCWVFSPFCCLLKPMLCGRTRFRSGRTFLHRNRTNGASSRCDPGRQAKGGFDRDAISLWSCPTPPTAIGVKTHRGYSSPPAFKGELKRKKQRCFFEQRMAEVFRNYLNGSVCLQRRAPLKLNKQVRLLCAAWNKSRPIDCCCTTWQTWHSV